MQIRCPDCGTGLASARYEGEPIAFCAGCGGILLAKARLAKIARIRETVIPRDLPTPPQRPVEARRSCPMCNRAMRKAKVGKLRPTTVDLCEDCVVLWLDRGEMDNIQLDYELAEDNRARGQDADAPARAGVDPAPTAVPAFQCPKCAHPQERGTECSRCGIVFSKYEAMMAERSARDAEALALAERVDAVLDRIAGWDIQQRYHLTEALVGFERANQYSLQSVPASSTRGHWQIEEINHSGLSILGRNVFGLLYTFTMQVLDETRTRVALLERRTRFYFHRVDVFDESGRFIGHARRRFSFFNRVITLHDDADRELLRIVGPYHRPWTFRISQSGVEAGTFLKQWSGLLKEAWTDADRFSLRFVATLDRTMRRLLFGGMMLVDSLYFEGKNPFLRHFFSAPGVQLLLVAGLAGAFWGAPDLRLLAGLETPPPAVARSGRAIVQHEFQDLIDRRQSLGDLAGAGGYSVVEVYLDTCPVCRQLERGFPAFTKKRRDVTVQRVHFPEQGISFTPTGTSEQEVLAQARDFETRVAAFRVCGTPHVEVYGPGGEPMARDDCGSREGTRFLRRWMAMETTFSLGDLSAGTGENAMTPVALEH